jgi:hypothetical protein
MLAVRIVLDSSVVVTIVKHVTTGIRSGTDWIGLIRLLDLPLHRVVYRYILEMEQMTERLLAKMDANTKAI